MLPSGAVKGQLHTPCRGGVGLACAPGVSIRVPKTLHPRATGKGLVVSCPGLTRSGAQKAGGSCPRRRSSVQAT